VPVVSEDPRPYYPATDYTSEEGSWPESWNYLLRAHLSPT
jgi:hypothetical protein